MRDSEIFNSFIKIAQDKGLISEDAPEKAKKVLEKTHRADSLDISAIEALYGVKPNTPKDMEYTRNIIEDAHPNSAIISPAYDKLNGLFENNNERQDILLNIVNRNNNGHSTQHKNAKKDFILSLVKIGNLLDQKKANQLRVLSDICLSQVAIKKHAWVPVAIGIAAGIAAALGTLYVQQHMSFTNEGFQRNHEKLVAEIDDLISSNSNWGVGSQFTPEFHNLMLDFKNKIMVFYGLYQKVYPLLDNLEKPKTVKDLMELSQKPETDSVIKAYHTLRDGADQMGPYLATIKKNFASESYKARQTEDKGAITSLVDKMQVFHGGKGLVSDDFDDVNHALPPYEKSIADMLNIFKNAESLEKSAKVQMDEAMSENQKNFGNEMAPKSVDKPVAENFDVEDLEKDLTGGLGGLG